MLGNFDFDVISRSWVYLFQTGMVFTLKLTALAMVGVYFDLSPVLAWVGGSSLVLGHSLVLGLEDTGDRMSRLGKAELVHGDLLTIEQLLARIDAVTPDAVRAVAADVAAVAAVAGSAA